MTSAEEVTRHWSTRLLEPLTANLIVLVEGPADRIILHRLAELSGIKLDREGIVIFELEGSGFFDTAFSFFGPAGFDMPIRGVLDEDAREEWSEIVGVAPATLESSGYAVCNPDLEGMYVSALGGSTILSSLDSSGMNETLVRRVCQLSGGATINDSVVADFCRKKKWKIKCALAVAKAMTDRDLSGFETLTNLVRV